MYLTSAPPMPACCLHSAHPIACLSSSCRKAHTLTPARLPPFNPAQMARVVDDLAARTPGKRSLAMAAFARALRQIPTIIADNAGESRGGRGLVIGSRAGQGGAGQVDLTRHVPGFIAGRVAEQGVGCLTLWGWIW